MDKVLGRERKERLRLARRVVVKLGTVVVAGGGDGLDSTLVEQLVSSIAALHRSGRQIVLVSSGAVGLGARRLNLSRERLQDLVTRQACAAVGQSLLMHTYERMFGALDVKIAQVLLTEADFLNWQRYRNLRRTMEKLLKLAVLPIVNENDTVSTAELEYKASGPQRVFSDNDRLAALVASKLDADVLVLLTNVDGLLAPRGENIAPPGDPIASGEVVPLVGEVTPELRALARGRSTVGRGGMMSKIDAAEIVANGGALAIIANGSQARVLERIFEGETLGTTFIPRARMKGKRRWIAYAAGVKARVVVNEGAREALLRGKASLLPSGILKIEGEFEPFDVVSILDAYGREFARGIASCASTETAGTVPESAGPEPVDPGGRRQRVLVRREDIVLLDRS